MKIRLTLICIAAIFAAFGASPSAAQVVTGLPRYYSFTSGPDVIDLSNFNVQLSVPIINKRGRGLPFSDALSYNSSVWYPAGVSGAQTWTPFYNSMGGFWGWSAGASPVMGNVQFIYSPPIHCFNSQNQQSGTYSYVAGWVYYDPVGTPHVFSGAELLVWESGTCPLGPAQVLTTSGSTNDGSGYLLSVNWTSGGSWTVTETNGTIINSRIAGTSASMTDRNGNKITTTTSTGTTTYYDTLSSTTPILTVSGSGTPSSPITYTYTAPSGANASYTVKYTAYTVRTNFGCSGITEFGPTSENLVSEIDLPDSTKYTFAYEQTPSYPSDVTGRIASITLPTSGTIRYTYTGGNNGIECSDGSSAGLQRSTPDTGSNYWTYSRALGSGGASTTNMTDPQGNVTEIDFMDGYETERDVHQGASTFLKMVYTCYNGATAPCNSTSISLPIASIATTSKWPFASSSLESEKLQSYNGNGLITEKDEYAFGSGAPGAVVRKTLTAYATLGNNITAEPSSITLEDGSGNIKAQTTYCYDEGTPSGTTSCNAVGSPTTTSGTPQHVSVTGSRGNVTTVTQLVSGSTTLGKTLTYYDTGNVNVATGTTGAQTTLGYGSGSCGNSFVTTVTESVGSMTEQLAWNCTGGVVTSVTDENGQTTSTVYNDADFWRPAEILPPVGWDLITYTGSTETDNYVGIATASPTTTCTTTGSCRHDETLLDGLGRATSSYVVNDPDGETTASTSYDSDGRVGETVYPYRGTANGEDTYAYDALNRVTSITHADSTSSSVAYGASVGGTGVNTSQLCSSSTYGLGYPTLATDEAGKELESWTDGLGRTIEVDEPNSGGSLAESTCSAYDTNNNLTQVLGPTSKTRSYTYDDLSRVLSVTTPETNVGGTQYSTTLSYTSSGSPCSGNAAAPCSRTDPRGITTTYTYDQLSRPTKIAYSDATPTITYCYDGSNTACISGGYSSSYPKARRTAMSDGSGSTGWSYDTMGRIATEQRTIAGITKTLSYSYNEDSSIASITYPSGHIVNYTVGNAERPLSATDSTGNPQYAATASYAPTGAVSSVFYGLATGFTGTKEQRAYNNRMETTSIESSSSNGTAMHLSYCFNPFSLSTGCSSSATNNNGSVTGITNGVDSGEGQAFTYDNLNRILTGETSATSGSDCWGLNFTGGIDAVANLTTVGAVSGYTCSQSSLSVTTDAYNHLVATGFSYDNAGDMTGDSSYTYAFNAENRIKQASGMTGGPYCYIYDGDGMRVEKGSGGTCPAPTTVDKLYWRSIFGDVLAESDGSGNMVNEYVFFAGRRIAERTSSSVFYYYSDVLGTVHTATNATGQACYDASFTPYGQEVDNPNISQTCAPNYKFTGYELDSETGLYYAFARYYSPRLGRFMSGDPLGGDTSEPQSLNRYAYTINNPSNLIDPFGLSDCPPGMVWIPGYGCGFRTRAVPPPPDPPQCDIDGTCLQGISGGGGGGPVGGDGGGASAPAVPIKRCTAMQQQAAALAKQFDQVSSATGWLAFGSGVGTVIAAGGEEVTLGLDTPGTMALGSMFTYFTSVSYITGATAAALNSFANGNTAAMWQFASSQTYGTLSAGVAGKLPAIKRWADRVGDLASKVFDLQTQAEEACKQ